MSFMSIDIESRSKVDLRKTGVYPYSAHKSTNFLCIAYKIDGGQTKLIVPRGTNDVLDAEDMKKHPEFLKFYYDKDVELWAFNEQFERIMFKVCGRFSLGLEKVPLERWNCTQALGFYYNLPGKLDAVARALDVIRKCKEGHNNMMQLAKPQRKTKTREAGFLSREVYPEKYDSVYSYCGNDVDVEDACKSKLGKLSPFEQEVFNLNKKVNLRGLRLDVESCEAANKIKTIYKASLVKEFNDETGINPTQTQKFAEMLAENHNIHLPKTEKGNYSMTGEILEKVIKNTPGLNAYVKRLLHIRKEAARVSLNKIDSMLASSYNGVIRGYLQYYGASVTGRWAGRLIQPQNLPRGEVKDLDSIFNDLTSLSPEKFIDKYTKTEKGVISTIASCLRGFIISPPDKDMFIFDYSAIEGRVVSWLCDVEQDLESYRKGECTYRLFGMPVYGYTKEEALALAKDSDERAILKEGILSLCYGIGGPAYGERIFALTKEKIDIRCICKSSSPRDVLPNCEAHRITNIYRKSRPSIKQAWEDCEKAVLRTMRTGEVVSILGGRIKFRKKGFWLHMRLPSGRSIRYPAAEVKKTLTSWDEIKPQFRYKGKRDGRKTDEENADAEFSIYWRTKAMYGSKFFQNACQGIARDVMAEAMLRLEKIHYENILQVHDEMISIKDKGTGSCEEVDKSMCISPEWAKDLPLAVEGEISYRYKK